MLVGPSLLDFSPQYVLIDAGNPFVWKTDDEKSCAGSTGLATCDSYVANFPEAFEDAYVHGHLVVMLVNFVADTGVSTTFVFISLMTPRVIQNTGPTLQVSRLLVPQHRQWRIQFPHQT